MHRQRRQYFGIIRQMQVKYGLFKYCGCFYCSTHGGTWRQNHSSQKYVTPTFLRPFDGIRQFGEDVAHGFRALFMP